MHDQQNGNEENVKYHSYPFGINVKDNSISFSIPYKALFLEFILSFLSDLHVPPDKKELGSPQIICRGNRYHDMVLWSVSYVWMDSHEGKSFLETSLPTHGTMTKYHEPCLVLTWKGWVGPSHFSFSRRGGLKFLGMGRAFWIEICYIYRFIKNQNI